MAKWCFNYESGEYEYINTSKKMASVLTEANMFAIGMIANIVAKRKNAVILYLMMKMTTDPRY